MTQSLEWKLSGKNLSNLSRWNNGKRLLLPWSPSWCKFSRTRFARTPPGRNYNRWKRCPEQSCQVFGKWLPGPRNSAQLDSTSRSNNRNHIFGSSPGCLRLCSKILSSSLARSRSTLCGRPPLTPLNSTLCVTKRKKKKKKRKKKERKERKERGGKKNILRSTGKEKGEKTTKTGRTHRLVYEAKNSFFFFSSFLSDRDTAKRFFLPLVSQKLFFFFSLLPLAFPGLESSHRCVYYMHASLFLYENVSKNSIVHFDNFFFFLFSSSVQSVFLIFLRLWIIVNNSQPRRFLLPFNRKWLILSLFNFSSWKKGKSSETLRSLRSFNLWMIFQLSLFWSGSSSSKDPIDPTKKMTLEENFYRRFLYTTISRYY